MNFENPRSLLVISIFILLLSLSGCRKPPAPIVGKWMVTAGNIAAHEFFENGDVVLLGAYHGKWKEVHKNEFKVTLEPNSKFYESIGHGEAVVDGRATLLFRFDPQSDTLIFLLPNWKLHKATNLERLVRFDK